MADNHVHIERALLLNSSFPLEQVFDPQVLLKDALQLPSLVDVELLEVLNGLVYHVQLEVTGLLFEPPDQKHLEFLYLKELEPVIDRVFQSKFLVFHLEGLSPEQVSYYLGDEG